MSTKKKRAASTGELNDLHKMIAIYFKERIKGAMPSDDSKQVLNEDGEYEDEFVIPLSSAEIGNMVTFLKHNNISAEPDDETLSDLKGEFSDDYELRRAQKAEAIAAISVEDQERSDWLHS